MLTHVGIPSFETTINGDNFRSVEISGLGLRVYCPNSYTDSVIKGMMSTYIAWDLDADAQLEGPMDAERIVAFIEYQLEWRGISNGIKK